MATEVVVNMSIYNGQKKQSGIAEKVGPSPQELQKVVREFADVMSKMMDLLTKSGHLAEGKYVADVVKASEVARAAKESEKEIEANEPKQAAK